MTLSIESGGGIVEIEEDGEMVIMLEDTGNGILLSVHGDIKDRKAGDAVPVIKPVDFVSFRNKSYESQLRDSIESLVLNDTSGSHLMTKGSVSQEAMTHLQSTIEQYSDDTHEE